MSNIVLVLMLSLFLSVPSFAFSESYHLKGKGAGALFFFGDFKEDPVTLQTSGCTLGNTYVLVNDSVVKDSPGKPITSTTIFLSISEVDECAGYPSTILDATGTISIPN